LRIFGHEWKGYEGYIGSGILWQEDRERPGSFMDAVRKDMQESPRKIQKAYEWKQVISYVDP